MDARVRVRGPATVAGDGPAARIREAAELALLTALMLGGVYGVSCVAAWGGLPVSRGLLFEGRWFAPSWRVFPWADCAAMLLFMAAAPLGWEVISGGRLDDAGLRVDLRAGAFAALGLVPAAVVWALRAGEAPSVGRFGVIAVYMLVVAAAEEACFRGVVQRRLAGLVGLWGGVGGASALFVLWHGLDASPAQLLMRGGAGLGLGLLYRGSRSLLPPVLCHWTLNLALLV